MVNFIIQHNDWEDYKYYDFFVNNLGYCPETLSFSYDIWGNQFVFFYILTEEEIFLLKLTGKNITDYTILSDSSTNVIRNYIETMNETRISNKYNFDTYNNLTFLIKSLTDFNQCLIDSYEYSTLNINEQLITQFKYIEDTINNLISSYSFYYNSIYNVFDLESISLEDYESMNNED